MGYRGHLLVIVAAALWVLAAPSPAAAEPEDSRCTETDFERGICHVDEETGELVFVGEQTTPGTGGGDPGEPGGEGGGGAGDGGPGGGPSGPIPRPPAMEWCQPLHAECVPPDARPGDPEEPSEAVPPITITDIERFAPERPTGLSEPDGWGVRGRPVNFVLAAEPHVVTGERFGRTVEVRFTPAAFRIDSPTGTLVESSRPGASWQQLRLPEFSETDTSHVFEERGDHPITPTVVYTAEYRSEGSGWVPITGTLPISGETTSIRIVTVDTVLVPDPRP